MRTSPADGDAATAKKSAGDAIERAAKLEKEAAQLRKSNLELEQEIAPRHLSTQGQRDMIETLRAVAPPKSSLQYQQGDSESRHLAQEIAVAIITWGTPPAIPNNENFIEADGGVFAEFNTFGLPVAEARKLENAANVLAALLNKDGVRAITVVESTDPKTKTPLTAPGELRVFVGLKPDPVKDKMYREALERSHLTKEQIDQHFPEKKR